MIETLVQRMESLSKEIPDKLAVAFKGDGLTYSQLYEKITCVAGRIQELGVERGDRVLFSAVSKPEMVVLYLAIQYVGGVAVFVDKNATAKSVADIYHDAGARIVFTDKPLKDQEHCYVYSLRKVYAEKGAKCPAYRMPREDDLAELIYTSGTTGRPKGCMLTYKAIHSIWKNTIDGIGMQEKDITLLPLPLNHSFALRVLRSCLYLGATVVLQNGFTFAKEIENNLDRYHCTSIAIVPASVETVSRQMQEMFPSIMGRFHYIEVSAGSLSVEQRKRLTKQLPHTVIHNTWGSSESGGALFLNVTETMKNAPEKIAALGKPLSGIDVITLDPDGKAFKSDKTHPGRMAIRGDMQMVGYWKQPETTAVTLRDGWLLTSDMIYEENGYLYMLGRADDIINVGGEKVSPVEVENIAGEYPGLIECACLGIPDPEGVLGSVPILFLVTRSNYSESDLRSYLASRLEKYKVPVKYIEMIELPRNSMQKIDRKALRARWEKYGEHTFLNETVHTLLTRRSIRSFTDEKIEKDLLEIILQTGYHAPSGHNMQTWRFTVISNREEIDSLKEATRQASIEKNVHFYGWENPAVIVLVSNDCRNPDRCQDASCAEENMMLAAWSYGIGSVWLNPLMTLRDNKHVKDILDRFGIPENHTIWSTVAMGYPTTEGVKLKKNPDVIHWVE